MVTTDINASWNAPKNKNFRIIKGNTKIEI